MSHPALLVAALIALVLVNVVLFSGGLDQVARGRKYKSGTGWCFWRWTDVDSEYILRLHVLKTPWCAVCLHWIRKPDAEPWLHDHPVSFLSIILRGKYAELRQRTGEPCPHFLVHRWLNFISADEHDRHRIVFTRKHTLTLCFMGPKTREWGFHTQRGWIGWKAYYAQKRADPPDNPAWPMFWKDLNERVDKMSAAFTAKYSGKIFVDEDVRVISHVAGDFDDEAPTEPRR